MSKERTSEGGVRQSHLAMLDHGIPVIVCSPHEHRRDCDPKCDQELNHPPGWQRLGVEQARDDIVNYRPGTDTYAVVTGHGVDAIDVDTKNGAVAQQEREAAESFGAVILGINETPSGGAHLFVASTGIATAAKPVNGVDFRGGCVDGTGRGLIYLPGAQRPKYRGRDYSVRTPIDWRLLDTLDLHEQREALKAYLTSRGINPRTESTPVHEPIEPEPVDRRTLPRHLLRLLKEPVEAPDRSERFHRLVAECYRADLSEGQTVTVLGSWPPGVDKYGSRLDSEVARSWAKVAHDDAGAPVGGHRPAISGTSEQTTADSAGWRLNAIDGDMMVAKRMKYLWEDRIPVGAITLAPGEEGVGKSTVCMRIAADLTRGIVPGEFLGTPRHVIVVAPEDGLYEVAMPRLQQAGADMGLVTFISSKRLLVDDGQVVEDGFSLSDSDRGLLADMVRVKDTALIVFDSFVSMLPNKVDSRSYKDVNKTLAPLKRFAEQSRVAILAPWHLNKSSGDDTALRMMDSRAFRTGPRSVLLMVADPEKPGEGLIALDKVNATALRAVPAIRYRIRSSTYQVEEVDEDTGEILFREAACGVVDFIGEEPGFGRDNARAMLNPDGERTSAAQGWLREYLTLNGETLVSEVLSKAKEAGFSRSATYKAFRAIGGHSRPGGSSGKPPKRWAWWSLPESPSCESPRVKWRASSPGRGCGWGFISR